MRWAPVLLAGLLLLAGCIGETSDADDEDVAPQTTEDRPANASALAWTNETFEGQVTGASVPMVASVNAPTGGSTLSEFTVPNGTQALVLELATDGGLTADVAGEIRMNIGGPDCEPTPESTCEETVATEGGNATWQTETPDAGQWHARIFASSPVVVQAGYTLEVLTLVPADASTAAS